MIQKAFRNSGQGRRCSGYNNIVIGNDGRNGESCASRIGTKGTQTNAYVAGISGVTVPTGVAVIIWQTANFVEVSKGHKRSDGKVTTP